MGVYEMKVNVTLDITDCRDCPFKRHHYGQDGSWELCGHPNLETEAYGNILWGAQEQFKGVPDWCPFGLGGN
jgi:hypothetical protein